jgi:hypothetical protein
MVSGSAAKPPSVRACENQPTIEPNNVSKYSSETGCGSPPRRAVFGPKVQGLARSLVRAEDVADDVAQEAWLRARERGRSGWHANGQQRSRGEAA